MKFQLTNQGFSLRKLPIILITAIAFSLFALQALAADGDVDTSFGTNGIVNETSPFVGHFSVVVQPDGKIIAVGHALVVTSSPFSISNQLTIVRYNPNGSRDTGFGTNGSFLITLAGKNLAAPTLLLQSDGKIIVLGRQQLTSGGNFNPILLRYNANGTPDTTFGVNGLVTTTFSGVPSDAVLQPDGKIVYAANLDGQPYCVVRHNSDGSLDTSFGGGGKFCAITAPVGTGSTDSIALQADGKIVFSGSFATSFTNPFDFIVFRVNSNGTIDPSFDSDGYVVTDLNGGIDTALSVIVKPDGKILAIGSARAVNAPDTGFGLVQYNADGSLDASFGTGGKALTTFAGGEGFTEDFPAALQSNGKIFVGRSRRRTSPNLGNETQLARFNPNGSLDTTFGTGGQIIFVPIQNVRDLILQPDGKIVATGLNQNNESITARFFNSDTVRVNNPTPTLASINPSSAVAGSAALTLNVTGTGFVQSAIIRWNGKDLTTTFIDTTTISASVAASDLAVAGTFPITVFNPLPGGGVSNAVNFTVNGAVPVPMLTGLGVTTVTAGISGTFDLIGSNFNSSTVGYINDKAVPTTFVSSTKLTIAYAAADVSCPGIVKINITNSPVGGGLNLMAAPAVTTISPTEVVAGSAAFTLTVNGNGFCGGTKIRWNGVVRTTTLVNAQQATTAILASEITSFGSATISVISADGIVSNNFPFTIKSPIVPVDSEADVTPRPNGKRNGTVAITDWVQVGRFYAGLDQISSAQEFQRTDTAPKASLGDGKILLADWVQAGRYAIGLDAVVAAGGPTVSIPNSYSPGLTATLEAERILRAVNANFIRGQVGTMQIALDAQGNENAVSFSLQYDPKVLSFVEATAGDGASGATVLVNSSQVSNGRIGIAIMLPPGQQLIVGTRNLVNLRFTPNGGIDDVNTSVSFSDQLLTREVVDAFATSITQISYVGATVNITGKAVATVSAANYAGGELAADSIASVFGLQLSSMTQAAVSLPLPISLGGSQIVVKDSRGVERFSPLLYVSPGQINFQIPVGSAEGIATLTVFSGAGASQTGLVIVGKVAPALFSADSTGAGLATGSALLVRADGSRTENGLARYDAATSKFIGQPIDTGGSGDQVYLTLYGTGIKNRSDLANVKVKIGGIDAPIEYAGAQGFFVGLDQLNIRIPAGLAGKGEVIVETSIENKPANQLRIVVK